MADVQTPLPRYIDLLGDPFPDPKGEWVKAADVTALEAKYAELLKFQESLKECSRQDDELVKQVTAERDGVRFELVGLEQTRLRDNKYLLDQITALEAAPCPHCHLPRVLPEPCSDAVNDALNERIAADGKMYEAGYFARQKDIEHLTARQQEAEQLLRDGQCFITDDELRQGRQESLLARRIAAYLG